MVYTKINSLAIRAIGFQPPCHNLKPFTSKGSKNRTQKKCPETNTFCLIANSYLIPISLLPTSTPLSREGTVLHTIIYHFIFHICIFFFIQQSNEPIFC